MKCDFRSLRRTNAIGDRRVLAFCSHSNAAGTNCTGNNSSQPRPHQVRFALPLHLCRCSSSSKICFVHPVAQPPGKAGKEKAPLDPAAAPEDGSRLRMLVPHAQDELHEATNRHARISRCTRWKHCSIRKPFSLRSSGTRVGGCSLGAAKMARQARPLPTSSTVDRG